MKLTRIEGPAHVLACRGCGTEGIGGSVPYLSASTEEVRQPAAFYCDLSGVFYCASCAAKLVEEDPTRSITQFYDNTEGTVIAPEVL